MPPPPLLSSPGKPCRKLPPPLPSWGLTDIAAGPSCPRKSHHCVLSAPRRTLAFLLLPHESPGGAPAWQELSREVRPPGCLPRPASLLADYHSSGFTLPCPQHGAETIGHCDQDLGCFGQKMRFLFVIPYGMVRSGGKYGGKIQSNGLF